MITPALIFWRGKLLESAECILKSLEVDSMQRSPAVLLVLLLPWCKVDVSQSWATPFATWSR